MQNLTTKFNILYNSNLLLDEAEQNRMNAQKENYQKDLPVFIEPNETSIANNQHLMDSVVQKAVTIIHDKRESKYVGDAYFLMARANYEKGNYYNAAEFFSYVTKSVDPAHTELMASALIWKARSLLQIGYLEQVPKVLDSAWLYTAGKKHAPSLYYATRAQYYNSKHQTDLTIQALNEALKFNQDRKLKLRWHYLLGQLYTKQGDWQQAISHFNKVVRSNASYEMSFNAALNQVFMPVNTTDTSSAQRVQKLKRMLKDDKNKAFKDQIYYRIGEIYEKDGQDSLALKSFNNALREPSTNDYQKATTYLKMADIHFRQGAYEEAKHYYDSTATVIKSDFPNYDVIQAKINNLDRLVSQLNSIKQEEQLQYLAKLPEEERNLAIDSLLNKQKATKKEDQSAASTTFPTFDPSFDNKAAGSKTNATTDGRFYFNNPTAVSNGISQFKRLWGNRPHTDNWRFSNKTSPLALNNANNLPDTAVTAQTTDSLLKKDILQRVPLSDSAMLASNQKIIDAYTKLGAIYRDDLEDIPDAIMTYTTLLDRFPDLAGKDLIFYNLYRLYANQGNENEQSTYKKLLLTEYPQSIYTKIITDPRYLEKLNANAQVLNDLYTRAYNLYAKGDYPEVQKLADSVDRMANADKKSSILVQMDYLRALAIGRMQPLEPFENALKEILKEHPEDQLISPLIKEHLNYIDSNRLSLQKRSVVLVGMEAGRTPFVDEPIMTRWPELVFNRDNDQKVVTRRTLAGNLPANETAIRVTPFNGATDLHGQVKIAAYQQKQHLNSFGDLELLPDSATYFYVIAVHNARINLNPSRYGIGQFNRGQYANKKITHQIKRIEDDLQLLYIGPFLSYKEVKAYEEGILPLLPAIMKIPADNYHTFVITESNLTKLTDVDQVNDYTAKYQEQF